MDTKDPLKVALEEARRGASVAFELAQDKLRRLIEEKKRIDTEIADCQKVLFQMAPACGIDAKDPLSILGLTDAVRYVIAVYYPHGYCATSDVMDALVDAKFKLPESNPLAAIQTVIKRLVENNEIEDHNTNQHPAYWKWTGVAAPPSLPVPRWMLETAEERKERLEKEAEEIPF